MNPGSKTLSVFKIDPQDPLHPKLVGQPADTQGDFPMSVAYSDTLKKACVLNGGAKNGVTCFDVSQRGLQLSDKLLSLPQLKTQTPPLGPPNTASDIAFNPSSSALFLTIKGTPTVPGYIIAFSVKKNNGKLNRNAVVSQPPQSRLDFSISFLGDDASALITDPAFGASVVTISKNLTVTEKYHETIPLQGAACWGVYSPRYRSAYVIDAGRPNITVLDPAKGNIKGSFEYDASAKGGFDTVIHKNFMYFLTGDSSILVADLSKGLGKEVEKYSLSGQGPVGDWQGIAAWPTRRHEKPYEDT